MANNFINKKICILNTIVIFVIIFSFLFMTIFVSRKPELVGIMTAISPIFALIIALYLPIRQDYHHQKIEAEKAIANEAANKEFQELVVTNLTIELLELAKAAHEIRRKINTHKGLVTAELTEIAIARPIFENSKQRILQLPPELISCIVRAEAALMPSVEAIEGARKMTPDMPWSSDRLDPLLHTFVKKCGSYIAQLEAYRTGDSVQTVEAVLAAHGIEEDYKYDSNHLWGTKFE